MSIFAQRYEFERKRVESYTLEEKEHSNKKTK